MANYRILLSTSLLATALIPLRVQAQEAVESPDSTAQIVVTGAYLKQQASSGKDAIPLIEIPQAISIVTSEDLQARGVTRIADALFSVAGVSRSSTYGFYDAYTMRGFDASYGSLYLDGMINEAGGGGSNYELSGLQSVEAVKGPASALFGGGSLGGIINLVSKRPVSDQTFVDVSASTGSYNLVEGTIDANLPLDKNGTFTARVIGLYRDSDSFVDHAGYNRIYIQPSLSWQMGADTNLTLIGTLKRDHDAPFAPLNIYGTVIPLADGYRLPRNFAIGNGSDETAIQNENRKTIALMFDHGFSENLKLTVNARYMTRDTYWDKWMFAGGYLDEELDDDGIAIPGTGTILGRYMYGPYSETFKSYLADTRLTWKVDTGPIRHNLLGGVDFRKNSSTYSGDGDYDESHFPLNVRNPDYTIPLNPVSSPYEGYDTGRQLGFYFQDHIEFGDRFTLTLNGRWDRANFNGEPQTAFSPRVGATYKIVPGLSFYSSYSKSFTPQFGSQIVLEVDGNGDPSVIGQAPPERGNNIEAGAKFDIEAANLAGMVSFYRLTRSNVLTGDPEFPMFSRVSGKQRSYGAEVELHWQPSAAFGVDLAYTYIRGEYLEDTDVPVGTPLPNIPRHNVTALGRYVVQSGPLEGVGASVGLLYNSDRFNYDTYPGPGQSSAFTLEDYFLVDLGLSYRRDNWGIQLNVNNVFDKWYYPDACCITRVTPGQPRNWRVTFNHSF